MVLSCFHSYAVDAGTIPAKAKKGRTKAKLGSRKAFSLEESQLEVQQQTKSLSRQVPPRYEFPSLCVGLEPVLLLYSLTITLRTALLTVRRLEMNAYINLNIKKKIVLLLV